MAQVLPNSVLPTTRHSNTKDNFRKKNLRKVLRGFQKVCIIAVDPHNGVLDAPKPPT